MSEHKHPSVSGAHVRREIKSVIENCNSPTRARVVRTVASRLSVPASRVESEIAEMNKHGFVYLVPTDNSRGQEVRLP